MNEALCLMAFIVIVLLIYMIVHSLLQVPSKAQIYFVLSLISVTIFEVGILLENMTEVTIIGEQLCIKIQYSGQIILFITFLLFIENYVKIRIPRIIYLLQAIVGAITFISCYTMQYHQMFYKTMKIVTVDEKRWMVITPGIFYGIHYIDMSLVMLMVVILCINKYRHGSIIDKKRVKYILCGLAIVIIELILRLLGVFGPYNLISMALFIMMLFIFVAFFRYRYFDTIQAATGNVLNQGKEGIIVVDENDQILFVNPLIRTLFSEIKENTNIRQYEWSSSFIEEKVSQLEIQNKIYDVRYENLKNNRKYEIGYMLWFVDMTDHYKYLQSQKNYQKKLEEEVNAQAKDIIRQNKKIMKLQENVIISVANIIESRDGTTGEHVKRTSDYVRLLLKKMKEKRVYQDKLTDEYVEQLCNAAPMHDIGKIAIPDRILQKPDKLVTDEIEIMNTHTTEGGKIIKTTMNDIEDDQYITIAVNVATCHHERWDGTGYPKGLKKEEIPMEARIMAIADVFDALTAERPYKEAMSVDKAFHLMKQESGKHFDPMILQVFLESRKEFEQLMKTF